MAKPLTRALERERVASGGLAEASATETSGALEPETQIMASPPVAIQADRDTGVGADASVGVTPPTTAEVMAPGNIQRGQAPVSLPAFPSREQFAAAFPKLRMSLQDAYYDAIRDACAEFGIDTPLRAAAALAQWGHETGGLQYLEELGGTPYFLRYEGRRDLGNTVQGDGVRYHGRGIPMLTGKANYAEFGLLLGVDLLGLPGLAAQMPTAARLGGIFWQRRGLNEFADLDSEDGFRRMTQKLNGGVNGLADRHARWKAIRKIMGIDPKGK